MLLEPELGPDADDEAARLASTSCSQAERQRLAIRPGSRPSSAMPRSCTVAQSTSQFDAPAGEVGDVFEAWLARASSADADLALRAARRLAGSDPIREGGPPPRHAEVAERARPGSPRGPLGASAASA